MSPEARAEQRRETQARILASARTLFAEQGYERTTIRAIAAHAGVDPGLVMHYFGAKENLFATAVQTFHTAPDSDAAEPLTERLLAAFAARLTHEPVASLAVIRSMLTHDGAAEAMRLATAAHQAAIASAIDAEDAELRAALINAWQVAITIFRFQIKVGALTDAEPERVLALLRPCLDALTARSEPGRAGGAGSSASP
jgi:AcrR family transcriptional regulator